jgi:hypothetical protein
MTSKDKILIELFRSLGQANEALRGLKRLKNNPDLQPVIQHWKGYRIGIKDAIRFVRKNA